MQSKKCETVEGSNIEFNCYDGNIEHLSRYLIQLYFRTGQKYRYGASKINNLLIIYKLCCIKEGLNALNDVFICDLETRNSKLIL